MDMMGGVNIVAAADKAAAANRTTVADMAVGVADTQSAPGAPRREITGFVGVVAGNHPFVLMAEALEEIVATVAAASSAEAGCSRAAVA